MLREVGYLVKAVLADETRTGYVVIYLLYFQVIKVYFTTWMNIPAGNRQVCRG